MFVSTMYVLEDASDWPTCVTSQSVMDVLGDCSLFLRSSCTLGVFHLLFWSLLQLTRKTSLKRADTSRVPGHF